MKICIIDGCNKKVHGRGLCNNHYTKWLRQNNPNYLESMRESHRRWLANNKEQQREYGKDWRARNVEHRKITKKIWVENNRLKVQEYNQIYMPQYYQDHKEEAHQIYKTNYEKNYLTYITRNQQRRALELDAPGICTSQQLQWRWEMYGGLCWICLEKGKKTPATATDHVKPLTKGGNNWPGNLKPICKSCNSKKKNKWPFKVGVS